MGHYCWVCGRTRSNESFSGRGHRQHLCRDCANRPRAERDRIRALQDIECFFVRQRSISAKNIARLEQLSRDSDPQVRELAELVLLAARLHPGRRKRTGYLLANAPDLAARLVQHGLIEPPPIDEAEECEALIAPVQNDGSGDDPAID
jgi:hypothetical protein